MNALSSIILVALACSSVHGYPQRKSECDNVSENTDLLLPNPEDCGSYIQCVHQWPMVRYCPAGLHWSVYTKQCDSPSIAKCNNTEDIPSRLPLGQRSSCEGTSEEENVLLPNPEDCSSYIQCVHGKPEVINCPEGLHWSVAYNRCEYPLLAKCNVTDSIFYINFVKSTENSCTNVTEDDNVLLPNPEDCGSYIQCVHQKPEVMYCPEGLHWSAITNNCDHPWIVRCNATNTKQRHRSLNGCEGVPESIDVLLPNPLDCGTYVQCVHQQPMIRSCPDGLHWSVEYTRCEWPETARCKVDVCDGVADESDVLLPNPDDCASYIQCVHQAPMVRYCPEGLHWSVAANICDWPSLAQCQEQINP